MRQYRLYSYAAPERQPVAVGALDRLLVVAFGLYGIQHFDACVDQFVDHSFDLPAAVHENDDVGIHLFGRCDDPFDPGLEVGIVELFREHESLLAYDVVAQAQDIHARECVLPRLPHADLRDPLADGVG